MSAEVIPKISSGKSIDAVSEPITAENIDKLMPSEEELSELRRRLESLNFEVHSTGPTVSIVGSASLFKEVFGVDAEIETHNSDGTQSVSVKGVPTIPDSLRDLVRDVIFPEAPEWFE